MKVAVLGAGFQGVCVALELVRRGCEVDLFDENDHAISQAGWVNEGKIHLGFVYSNDPTMATAKLLARGALSFRRLLNRWIDFDAGRVNMSGPFVYAVHRDTLVPPEKIESYFERLTLVVREIASKQRGDYLGAGVDRLVEPLPVRECRRIFNPGSVIAAYRTIERSVDPQALAPLLRRAIDGCEHIVFHPATSVVGVTLEDGGLGVETRQGGEKCSDHYEHVVNALWAGRIALDATVGRRPKRPWLYRFKYGIRVAQVEASIPSTTLVLGPFGDLVRYSNGDLYLSWYPTCMNALSSGLHPPRCPRQPTARRSHEIFEQTFEALRHICPVLGQIASAAARSAKVQGGTIVAWGATEIDDVNSELHARSQVGCSSEGRYHSIDTGKYSLAPMFASEVADRICNLSRTDDRAPRGKHRVDLPVKAPSAGC